MMNVIIVGGGPIGSYCAYLLSRRGYEVTVLEAKEKIGSPVQCTGIVTDEITKFSELEEVIKKSTLKIIHKVIVHGKDPLRFDLKKPNRIVDRELFDRLLVKKAQEAGVNYLLSHKVTDLNRGYVEGVNDKGKFRLHFDRIIGADGPSSIVRDKISNRRKIHYWSGIQVRAKYKHNDCVEFFPSIGTYAWIVPEKERIARIGVVGNGNTKKIFDKFILRLNIDKKKIIEYQGGIIPRFDPFLRIHKGKASIVGDAATQVKATTGGGLVPGLRSAQILCGCIEHKKNYTKEWRKRELKNMMLHLLIRDTIDGLSVKEKEWLFVRLGIEKIKKVIEREDREKPSYYIGTLMLRDPLIILSSYGLIKYRLKKIFS